MNKTVYFKDLGLIDYKKAWDYQDELFSETIAMKIANRKNNSGKVTVEYSNFDQFKMLSNLLKKKK